jgi:hypothetical protein
MKREVSVLAPVFEDARRLAKELGMSSKGERNRR